ncbi:transporter substrate-binding domain-containing protein [Thiospirochaeta perfilievii]|uniref:Transporter substrate-binding domain-containing protein n=1 Tax=Thiospirochaeta perfilievii TaxID=252967 RepID=A0A5C1Q8N9_9SPIO|nr:transporter substrate-binding domain-containing protein [Thiospirochaeta perfilievii]QEN03728.1 transporter substrate-binding domain-containing protein [Thiospirochaeta perfilievii]
MKKLLIISIILLSFLGCKDDNNNKLTVAMELQYPPFEMSDESGNPSGISVDIAKDLGKYLGREVVIENIAWTGLIPSLQTNKADIIISSMTITDERAQVVDFSNPYIKSGLSLLINNESKVTGFADADKEGVVVAVKSGTTGANLAKNIFKKAEVRLFDEVAACVLEVSQGKADIFIYDVLTVYENYQRNIETTRMNLEPLPGSEGYWGMAVKKGNDELLRDVNKFIKEYQDNGGFNKLGDKYLGYIKTIFDDSGIPFFFDI